jgi:hypothetical protein
MKPKSLQVKAPCDSLVFSDDLAAHRETCAACLGGWSVFDRPESEERKLDDPRRGHAEELNRKR